MQTIEDRPIFYVYEHWRSDQNRCFYVGKGYGNRAFSLKKRKGYHHNCIEALRSRGVVIEIRIIHENLPEGEALRLEVERISYWRSLGIKLTNATNGGEGVCGHKHSEETRAKIRQMRALQKCGPRDAQTREKISAAQRGILKGPNPEHSRRMSGRKQSAEEIERRSKANTGKKRSPESRARMSVAQKGHPVSDEARINMSLAHRGKKPSPETIAKRVAALTGRKRGPMSQEQKNKISITRRAHNERHRREVDGK